jgi:indoleamine 2,3-dioxygenase
MFPNGVIYEGVSDQPFKMRGESGANDSMIPLGDNLLELTPRMPINPLTNLLHEFRNYRPRNHRVFLEYVQHQAQRLGIRSFACADANSAALYLANLDMIRAFRHRHWLFTKEYIIKRTAHPVATGGSPIVTWLPNQLAAVLETMLVTAKSIQMDKLTAENRALVVEIIKRADAQKRVLSREVIRLAQQCGVHASQVDAVEASVTARSSITV